MKRIFKRKTFYTVLLKVYTIYMALGLLVWLIFFLSTDPVAIEKMNELSLVWVIVDNIFAIILFVGGIGTVLLLPVIHAWQEATRPDREWPQ